ncbi:unnamed protein product [Acanthosepion pharaonis]|uniref:Uncharacterized protein n=1 Tax=Acanthosepion pharaonis TaxID=158019 RepID=A0A812DU63_ACAPH|nr:unnamed protein product [Sepia pharaonis]
MHSFFYQTLFYGVFFLFHFISCLFHYSFFISFLSDQFGISLSHRLFFLSFFLSFTFWFLSSIFQFLSFIQFLATFLSFLFFLPSFLSFIRSVSFFPKCSLSLFSFLSFYLSLSCFRRCIFAIHLSTLPFFPKYFHFHANIFFRHCTTRRLFFLLLSFPKIYVAKKKKNDHPSSQHPRNLKLFSSVSESSEPRPNPADHNSLFLPKPTQPPSSRAYCPTIEIHRS